MFVLLFTFLFALVSCEGVSLKITGYNEICVYAQAKYRGEKLAFYYSVQSAGASGNYEISTQVHSPKDEVVLEADKYSTGDYVFSATSPGEYSFCFINHDSAEKMIYIDVTAESDTITQNGLAGSEAVKPPAGSTDHAAKQDLKQTVSNLDSLTLSLNAKMDALHKQMMYIKTRESRNISTGMIFKVSKNIIVKSTQSRIRWFTFLESSLMIGISAAQVFLIRTFFSRPGSMSRI